MRERVGAVSVRPLGKDGRLLLTMSDGRCELVEPDVTHDQLADRYRLDRVVTAPTVDFCAALHLDGPLAGQIGYAINELGYRTRVFLPPQPGGPTGWYEVIRLVAGDQPAEARFVGFTAHPDDRPGGELPGSG